MYKSPNGTIRNIVGGTVFREPLFVDLFPGMFRDGLDQFVLEDMLLEINIEQLTLQHMGQESLR